MFVAAGRDLSREVKFCAIGFSQQPGNLGAGFVGFFVHHKACFRHVSVEGGLLFGHFPLCCSAQCSCFG